MFREAATSEPTLSSPSDLFTRSLADLSSTNSHEAWSKGLTAKVFWENADEILAASRDDIDSVISRILDDSSLSSNLARTTLSFPSNSTRIRETDLRLAFAVESPGELPQSTLQIAVEASKNSTPPPNEEPNPLHLSSKPGKAGYNTFFGKLEPTLEAATKTIRGKEDVVVLTKPSDSQSEANDLGLAVALILLGTPLVLVLQEAPN